MWFLWNIFSKGTHMLQCLCGKSLKKNKNPTGRQGNREGTRTVLHIEVLHE
ncbi:Hypothetical predicted protein [Lynx pardinus]|uniref:Uncharacterized protein n=1 Tax=Lynx pardinus TaxID=191816 RepID=A0A485PRZ2_LYNPA|nr:Hypothetical predicted protein [Lynx pardinus]